MAITFTASRPSAPWRLYVRGKYYWCKTEEDAKKKAADLDAGRPSLSERDLVEFTYAKELLAGTPILQVVKVYLASLSGETRMTVQEVIDQHLKVATGRKDYLEKKTHYLDKLSDALGKEVIGNVTPSQIEGLLLKVSKSDWVRNTYLAHLRVLWNYAVRMRLTKNNPTAGIGERKTTASKVILTLPDTQHLLDTCAACCPVILPAIALQLFTGIRTSEIMRLDWSAVKPGEAVDIGVDVSKTHERRVIDWWPPRLSKYITKQGQGTVIPFPDSYEHHKWELVSLARKAKAEFVFGQNCMRHSFASFAVAYFQDAGKVALLMGQRDVNILFRHYRHYRTQAEGAQFFGMDVKPPAGD